MEFRIKDKNLEKLIKNIDGLLGKLTRFNISGPSALVFILNKVTLEISAIVSHNVNQDLNYKFYLNDRKLIYDDNNEKDFITQETVKKFIEKIDPLSVAHNVILSNIELNLSLIRDDLMIYTYPIIIYIPNKLKEFLSLKLIEEIVFEYDEQENTFSVKDFILYDNQNPITQRQKILYLSESDIPIGYFLKNREDWLSKNIIELCKLSDNININNYVEYDIKQKPISDLDEWIALTNTNQIIKLPGEFIKTNPKKCESWYINETLKEGEVNILSILNHITYTTKVEQYVFYRYYAI